MTDETRDQIKKDASEWADAMLQAEEDFDTSSFELGCEHQHPIAYEQGKKDGWDEAIKSFDLDEVIKALRECASGCSDAVDMFESATDPNAISIKNELQGYVTNGCKVLRKLESLKKPNSPV